MIEALSFVGASVVLGNRRVVDDVTVALSAGQVTAIVGRNGAGKTSLLTAAAGLLPLYTGRVTIGGRDVAALGPRERARRIGYLPQGGDVYWDLTVAETVALGRLAHRAPFAAPSAADRSAVAAALATTQTAALCGRRMGTLSGGERARVLLARVIAGAPGWLLADEPLASLDPSFQFDLLDRLRAVTRTGTGVVIVLHDLAHAARIADTVLLLDAGRLVAAGPPSDVLTPALGAAIFGIDVRWVDVAGHSAPMLVATGRAAPELPGCRPTPNPRQG